MKLLDFFTKEYACCDDATTCGGLPRRVPRSYAVPYCRWAQQFPQESALAWEEKLVEATDANECPGCMQVTPKGETFFRQLRGDFT